MNNINKEVITLPPFKRLCMSIGELPSSYLESMTYYESLLWFTRYLKDTVIPTINNNGEAVEELQAKYVELVEYVNNYFDNLDIQTEIDNKLDDMAESGQLAEIIAQYLEVSSVLGFDTKSALKGAENIVSGSICKTIGDLTYNDGKGNYYKIRDLVEGDVIDDDELVELTNFPLLVAEKLPDYRMDQVESDIDTINDTTIPGIQSDLSDLQESINELDSQLNDKDTIFLGDSYAEGYTPDGNVPQGSRFYELFANMEGISNYYLFYQGGVGFYQTSLGNNILDVLQNASSQISDKLKIRKIFVVMGWNESYSENNTFNNISNAIADFVSYCKTNYPNATVYIGQCGYCTNFTETNRNDRLTRLSTNVTPAYSNTLIVPNNSFVYLKGLDRVLHNSDYMASDGVHPNAAGHQQLAKGIYNSLHSGDTETHTWEFAHTELINPSDGTSNVEFWVRNDNENKNVRIQHFDITYTQNYPSFSYNNFTPLVYNNSKTIRPVENVSFPCSVEITNTSNTVSIYPAILYFSARNIGLKILNTSTATISNVKKIHINELVSWDCHLNIL